MREMLALARAGWQGALTYRMGLVFSLLGLVATLVPVYFVAGVLQPIAARSIALEGGQYFSFLVVGAVATTLIATCLTAPAAALAGAIGAGTLEAILATPARPLSVMLGLVGYDLSWATIKSVFLVAAGALLGLHVALPGLPTAVIALALMLLCHLGLGFVVASLVLAFRTAGPLGPGIITASTLLGGVYYSTSVIPSWLQQLSEWIPLTSSLRALRRGLLMGESVFATGSDLTRAVAFAVSGVLAGYLAMRMALRHARHAGLLTRE